MTAPTTHRAFLFAVALAVTAGAGPALAQPDAAADRDAAVRECVSHGDQACLVRVLRRDARGPREMAILIEAYLRTGQAVHAENQMRVFLQRYPNHGNAPRYRQHLGLGPPPPPEPPVDHRVALRECLQRGDMPCVIQTLRGRAQGPNDLSILIEAYRRTGNTVAALQQMRVFVQRYPNHSRAERYIQLLEVEVTPPPRR